MKRVQPTSPIVEIDFTDAQLTGQGVWVFLGRLWQQLKLGQRLAQAIPLKRRRRGASDAEMLLSLLPPSVRIEAASPMWDSNGP